MPNLHSIGVDHNNLFGHRTAHRIFILQCLFEDGDLFSSVMQLIPKLHCLCSRPPSCLSRCEQWFQVEISSQAKWSWPCIWITLAIASQVAFSTILDSPSDSWANQDFSTFCTLISLSTFSSTHVPLIVSFFYSPREGFSNNEFARWRLNILNAIMPTNKWCSILEDTKVLFHFIKEKVLL